MPIRIEHQPSAFSVGVAGYAAGRGAARERQGKQFLDLFQDQQRFQSQQNLLDQRNTWMDERDAKREWSTPPALMQVPSWAGQKDKEAIARIDAGIYGIRSGKFRHDDENARQTFDDLMRQREEIMGRMEAPDPGEQASQNWGYLNPKTGQRAKMGEQQGEGMVLWDYSSGGPVHDNSGEQAAAKQQAVAAEKAAEKQQAAAEKYRDELIKRTDKIIDNDESKTPIDRERARRKAEQEMYDDGIMPPGEKPHMGSPSLGPEITPLSDAESGAAGGDAAIPEFDVVPGVGVRPVAPAGAQGGGSVREDGMIDLTTRQQAGWDPGTLLDADGLPADFTDEQLRQARRIAQTPAGAAALKKRYGVDFAMQEDQPAAIPPLDTTQRQHVDAMRGSMGTGEGIPSDRSRLEGSILGAGSTASRMARVETGGTTKYAGSVGPDESRASEMANWIKYQNGMDRFSQQEGDRPASPNQDPLDGIDAETYKQKRLAGQQRRKANLQASNIRIATDAEYDRLRPGTWFTGPDGKVRRKV